jgi:hypothetical protein
VFCGLTLETPLLESRTRLVLGWDRRALVGLIRLIAFGLATERLEVVKVSLPRDARLNIILLIERIENRTTSSNLDAIGGDGLTFNPSKPCLPRGRSLLYLRKYHFCRQMSRLNDSKRLNNWLDP